MSRFRKLGDFVDPPRPPRPEPPAPPRMDDDRDDILDAEVVDDPSSAGAPAAAASSPAVPATGQPLLVTVAQLQLAVNDLQREVADKLERIASRLDGIEARSATTTDEPDWVRRLEAAVEGHAGRSATATAAAITTMGEQQRADLQGILARLDEAGAPAEPVRPAWVDELRNDDLAGEVAAVRAELGAVATSLDDRLAAVAAPAAADDGATAEIIDRLADIREALRLLVG